jgi:hypothetical protein
MDVCRRRTASSTYYCISGIVARRNNKRTRQSHSDGSCPKAWAGTRRHRSCRLRSWRRKGLRGRVRHVRWSNSCGSGIGVTSGQAVWRSRDSSCQKPARRVKRAGRGHHLADPAR